MNIDSMTEDELDNLAVNGTDEERRAVARHPCSSLHTLLYLAEGGLAEEVEQNPMMPLYLEVGSADAIGILVEIAEQTKRPERLEELSYSIWEQVLYQVAWNNHTPLTVLARLAKDENEYLRRGVAKNPNSTPDILDLLSKDKVANVRDGVASNKNSPPKVLMRLAKDNDFGVLRCVAKNTSSSPEVLSILAKSPKEFVRLDVAGNMRASLETIGLLTIDRTWNVRRTAKATLYKLQGATL